MTNELHAVLAVVDDKKKFVAAILGEAATLFTKKEDNFEGHLKTYTPKAEDGDELPPDTKPVNTTVEEKLKYVFKSIASGVDTILEVEETNGSGNAKADLTIDGVSLGKFSATSLLSLERELSNVRTVCKEIPTTDPAREWTLDETVAVPGLYKSAEENRVRTIKIEEPVTLYPATDRHPAQTALRAKDIPVGIWHTIYRTGKMTPLKKSVLLSRIDNVLEIVKRARAQANSCEVVKVDVSSKIFEYILG